ncbi:MAG: glycosyltransferase family 4 protein [Calditrichaeota bacterium]|nr:glycosyltransferase family 4 protein [Calditrichota bacterium]
MKVGLITCWYKHQIYSNYSRELRTHLQQLGVEVKIIASECGCGLSHREKQKNLIEKPDIFLNTPYPVIRNDFPDWRRKMCFKMALGYNFKRGIAFHTACPDCDVLHFQQVNDSFGAESLTTFLARPSKAKKVVTVHELDPFQLHYRKLNRLYNRAHRVFVHSNYMKAQLMALGVEEEKLQIIPFGVDLPQLNGHRRTKIVYYGGHHLLSGKGFHPFLKAVAQLKRWGYDHPVVVHGGFSIADTIKGKRIARGLGIDSQVEWLGAVEGPGLHKIYQEGVLSVIPFTKGTGAFAATLSMANATPVVATQAVELPEYLEDAAVYVPVNDQLKLQKKMVELLSQPDARQELAQRLRRRAERIFAWPVVAKRTLEAYED